MNFTYSKIERLSGKILIDEIFNKGNKLYAYPLKVMYLLIEPTAPATIQTLISVSKRRFKRANKRNLLKRRIREAFRQNKYRIHATSLAVDKHLALVIMYNTNQICDYACIESAVKEISDQLVNLISV